MRSMEERKDEDGMVIGQLGVLLCILQTAKVTSVVVCWTYSGEILLPCEAETLVAGVSAISGGRTTSAVIISTPLGRERQLSNSASTRWGMRSVDPKRPF